MKYLAENLDARNLGQALIWKDNEEGITVTSTIQEIVHDDLRGIVTVHTSSALFDYNYGEEVETAMSPELRMIRIIMNAIEGLEDSVKGLEHDVQGLETLETVA